MEQAAGVGQAGQQDHGQGHAVAHITVNEKPVTMPKGKATGLQIKEAAISQGVEIQRNFILELDKKNENNKIIADNESVEIHDGLAFTAIRNDDNS
jgi:hypothetical protein